MNLYKLALRDTWNESGIEDFLEEFWSFLSPYAYVVVTATALLWWSHCHLV